MLPDPLDIYAIQFHDDIVWHENTIGGSMDPLDILGVDIDGVTSPTNDGTRGSALYAVPIRLNRTPTAREASLLVEHFDRPSRWTSMHRPGIAHVSGDRLVLDGTTIEEVKQYHAATVRLAVSATNDQEAQLQRQERAAGEQAGTTEAQHRRNVEDIAGEIDFG